MTRLAIIACGGKLPVELARAAPSAMVITLAGIPSELAPVSERHRLERIGALFDAMKAGGVGRVVFAGHLARPAFEPACFDDTMRMIAPRLMAALTQGDDGLLRTVIEIFEEQGFSVIGAQDVRPMLLAEDGLATGPAPAPGEERDIARAAEILRGISALDIGQGCVVAGGQCLGIETVQGTDALLDFVARTDPKYRRDFKGVYVKAAKRGQDLRIDLPTIGPRTVEAVAAAGLAGLVVEAGRVLLVEREETLRRAAERGLFLQSRAL